MSPLFTLGRQSIGVSALASVLPMNIQGWFPLGLTDLISLLSKGHSRVFSSTKIWKHQLFGAHPSLWSNSHPYMTTGKTRVLTIQTLVSKVISLLFNMLSRFVTAFYPRSKCLFISFSFHFICCSGVGIVQIFSSATNLLERSIATMNWNPELVFVITLYCFFSSANRATNICSFSTSWNT